MITLNFITSNKLKFDIAAAAVASLGDDILLKQLTIDLPEIQADTVKEVALHAARQAAADAGEPCIVSDAGLHIVALGGFPGPFLKYANQWLGVNGYLKLLAGTKNRTAYFEDALAIAFPDGRTRAFVRQEHGVIAEQAHNESAAWPANELFVADGHTTPLGHLSHDKQVAFWNQNSM